MRASEQMGWARWMVWVIGKNTDTERKLKEDRGEISAQWGTNSQSSWDFVQELDEGQERSIYGSWIEWNEKGNNPRLAWLVHYKKMENVLRKNLRWTEGKESGKKKRKIQRNSGKGEADSRRQMPKFTIPRLLNQIWLSWHLTIFCHQLYNLTD